MAAVHQQRDRRPGRSEEKKGKGGRHWAVTLADLGLTMLTDGSDTGGCFGGGRSSTQPRRDPAGQADVCVMGDALRWRRTT